MKKLLFLVLLTLTTLTTFAQQGIPMLKLSTDSTKYNVNGTWIQKGDDFFVNVQLNGNGNTTSRSLYFDFEFQNTAFDFLSAAHTGTGGNGGVLPYGSSITLDSYQYPGYSWKATASNTSTNGNQNYSTAAYTYTAGGPKTILRVYLNWASPNGLPYTGFDTLLRLRFKLKSTATGDIWDPIKMNFAASFNQNGTTGSTIMSIPLTSVITLNPDAKKYVKAQVNLNPNMDPTKLRVAFIPTDNTAGTPLMEVSSTGAVNIPDDILQPNKEYRALVLLNLGQVASTYNAAVTVSDYTIAQSEFVQQNLDGTYNNQNIMTGMGYKAAGDLTRLFSQAVSVDPLIAIPAGAQNIDQSWMSLMTFKEEVYNAATPANWVSTVGGMPTLTFTTPATPGTPPTLKLNYLLIGDINRNLSSPVVRNSEIATNSVRAFINTPAQLADINISLKNITVTSNSIEIPVSVNTNGTNVSALQMEFKYDATKIKFEEMKTNVPEGWYVFANNQTGRIKFGALDKDLKKPFTGEVIPFRLRFTALQNGLTINSFIEVTDVVDAAASNGAQVGVNLNTDIIKLTGIKNF